MRFPGADHEVVRGVLLEDAPDGIHVFGGIAPVAAGVEIAEEEGVLLSGEDGGDGPGDLAGDEGFAAPRALVIEENAAAGEQAVAFAVNADHPVGVELGGGVGAARLKDRVLALRRGRRAVHLRAGGLVEAGLVAAAADGFEKAHGAQAGDVAGVFGHVETDAHMALRGQMVELVRREAVDQIQDPFRAGEIAVMQEQLGIRLVGILIDMVNALGIEGAGAADDAVDFVAFAQKQLGQIRAVLSGNAGDECALHDCDLLPFVR